MRYDTLYNNPEGVDKRIAFYATMMNYICGSGDSSQLPAVAAILNLRSLNFRALAGPCFTRYLVAEDQFGMQVFVYNTTDFLTTWTEVVNRGLVNTQFLGSTPVGKMYKLMHDTGENIVADLATHYGVTPRNMFISGHGVGAAVAHWVTERAAEYGQITFPTCYVSSYPRFCTEGLFDTIRVTPKSVRVGRDIQAYLPPSRLWNRENFFPREAPLPPLYKYALGLTVNPDHLTDRLDSRINSFMENPGDNATWPTVVDNIITQGSQYSWAGWNAYHSTGTYILQLWNDMSPVQQQAVSDAQAVLNTTYGYSLPTSQA